MAAAPLSEGPETPASYDELLACSRCGACLPVCPSYSATLSELHSPRGRVQILRALAESRIERSPGIQAALDSCLDCRACETTCSNGVHPGQLALAERALPAPAPGVRLPLARRIKRFVLGRVLARPGWMEIGMAVTRICYQETGIQGLLRATLFRRVPLLARLDRYLPALPTRSVRQSLPEVVPAVGEQRGVVGLFLGCAMNTLFADSTRDTVRALTLLGYKVVIPRNAVCCGAPQLALGERDLALDMARHNVGLFPNFDAVITDCAACGAELKNYGHLLGTADAIELSARTRDFAEFAAPRMPAVRLDHRSLTYHAPCHLTHGQRVAPPEKLLRRLTADFRVLEEADRCCGSAGVYFAQQPAIADDAKERKQKKIRATGAEVVVSANPGCLLQLAAAQEPGDHAEITHISRIVARALEGHRT